MNKNDHEAESIFPEYFRGVLCNTPCMSQTQHALDGLNAQTPNLWAGLRHPTARANSPVSDLAIIKKRLK